ncbi:LmbU family transcriptional regulator [Nonomuraea rubra]|uniref:LmbU family transcriptional regulator n=1 Tax=Nonomuraea rubra TaxID=46180 RepID=UPI0036123C46
MGPMKMSTLNNGPRRDGLTIDGVVQTRRTSLTLPKKMSIEAWKKVGQQIWRISDSSTWWLGDWLVYGQRRFPDRYQRAIEETSLDYQTLRNYAWVARKFSPGRRRASLSLQHHAEVAALPEPSRTNGSTGPRSWAGRATACAPTSGRQPSVSSPSSPPRSRCGSRSARSSVPAGRARRAGPGTTSATGSWPCSTGPPCSAMPTDRTRAAA